MLQQVTGGGRPRPDCHPMVRIALRGRKIDENPVR